MGAFFKAELKDRFLEYALGNNEHFETQLLYDEFLRPNYSLEFAENLVQEIRDFDSRLIETIGDEDNPLLMVASTNCTQDFLEEGGFMHLHVQEEEKWDKLMGELSKSAGEHAIENYKSPAAISAKKREKRILIVLLTMLVFTFLFSLYTMLNQLFARPNFVSQEELDLKLEEVRFQYEQENLQLRYQLDSMRKQM